jgi:hypothetical protein
LVWALADGMARAMFSGNNEALIHDALAAQNDLAGYPAALGRVSAAMQVAGFVAILIGSLLAASASLVIVVAASLGPTVLALAVGLFIVEPPHITDEAGAARGELRTMLAIFRTNARLRSLSVANVLDTALGGAMWALRPATYALFMPLWVVGPLISAQFLMSGAGFHFAGRIIGRLGALGTLIYGQLYTRVVMIAASVVVTRATPWLMSASGISYGPETVASSTLIQAELHHSARASGLSANSLAASIAFAVTGPVFGALADSLGLVSAILIGQLCSIPVLLTYLRLDRRDGRT